jgi:glycolate oxidase
VSIADELRRIVGPRYVNAEPAVLTTYRTDGFTLVDGAPSLVVWPQDAAEVSAVMRVLHRRQVPVVARGGGTSLSGGAVPEHGAVVLHLSRLNRIVQIDPVRRLAEVEPGVVNQHISREAARFGLYYAPDPSSQQACTLGGNLAENAGGPHCLKYGVTVNHVRMADVVLPDGTLVRMGDPGGFANGVDALGLLVGSEGTLGIIVRAWVNLLPLPPAHATILGIFDAVDDASRAVSAIIADGIVPAALEMMDPLAVRAVERGRYRVGYPETLGAVLLAEVDGREARVREEAQLVEAALVRYGARTVRRAGSEPERALWWANRKTAFGAMGLLARHYYVQDGVIPRSRLPEALAAIGSVSRAYDIPIANVFHAGDGNLHPLLLYEDLRPETVRRVVDAGHEILATCLDLGGSVSGEHGIGIEKREDLARQYTPAEMAMQRALRDAFDPVGIANPGKIFLDARETAVRDSGATYAG